ncbi:MAG: hypothetical protein SCK29_08850 [Bacillota bacterium]|nr:hypothetical protein [Bacillota bacterium]MDW7684207.1 hypothetical protein [Bacillota bacterium]
MKPLLKTTVVTLVLLFAVIISSFLSLYKSPVGVAWAVETASTGFGISVSPASSFLNAPNAAPGDSVNSDLTVTNTGELDFCYNITAVREAGDVNLFDALLLAIIDETGNLLYHGPLSQLHDFHIGILGPGSSEVLNFTVTFPLSSDNNFQGLNATVSFVFTATEHPAEISGSIVWDPPLEKADVHVRKGVVMPIKFHLIKSDGTFDTMKRGIDLIITGVDDNGNPVEYVFSVVNNTLDWEEHGLNKPHYKLMFDTKLYTVAPNTYYTATVHYGQQVLGYTRFKSGH